MTLDMKTGKLADIASLDHVNILTSDIDACRRFYVDGLGFTEGFRPDFGPAGWMEGGLCTSFEKFVIDCEMLQQLAYYHQPVGVSDEDLAVKAIQEVGPTGHFLGSEHTQARYKTAFYSPFLSDWSNFENWEDAGALTTIQRANRIYKEALQNYELPPMDTTTREELKMFVERRKREGGAPTDF